MAYSFQEFNTEAVFRLGNEQDLLLYSSDRPVGLFTFIWTGNKSASVEVDGEPLELAPNSILSITPIQYFQFISGENLNVYQFNREFYCIKDHDKEVSCAGLLFFGNKRTPVVGLNQEQQRSFENLHQVFLEEIATTDNIQAEMLRLLLARFIIKTTRLFKTQDQSLTSFNTKVDLLRSFNLLVDQHFRVEHSVAFYADRLHRSPKTLSNVFGKMDISPLKVIHERIILEAKRLLRYTERSSKEIAYELGFEDPSHLSRLFKKVTGQSPSEFRSLSISA
ncbi:helix-turn-helix domain-containing protein [Aureitalea marina]|uniref:AraC family transcriptional regulator n=1 Tax=Aureitalea marina TaxID=930804 RepID=A0A2S7KRM7_9FLAO|nr:AraC family transcriptional regulator [Aureitalea marina]PQB05282.1 AraC family transcriptional regulator [Aureitalea marina]